MRTRLAWLACAVVAAAGMLVHTGRAHAAETTKANNTGNVFTGSSWLSNAVPNSTDVLVWGSTVTTANTVSLGGSGTVAGIKIVSPGGAVVIGNASGNVFGIGASGIDMSAATVNLSILSSAVASDLNIAANQDWNIASGRLLQLFSNNSSVNTRLTGSANITVKGSGTVSMLVSDSGGAAFNTANGNGTYSGNWTISGGSKVISQRNGTQAFGSGTITLDNGIISQQNGGWSFSNNIVLGSGSGTVTNDSGSVTAGRYMNLTGVISGAGGLVIANNNGAWGEGVILTGSNTLTGPITINASGVLRIGGDATTTMNGVNTGTLGSIPSSVAITNNGVFGFGWSVDSTFANAITGTGIVRLGRTGYTLPNIVLSLTGTSTYTGATQVNSGTIEIGGAGQLGNGSYGGNISTVANTAFRVATSQDQTLSGTISGAGVLVKSGAGTLTVSTSNSYSGGTTLNAGILSFGTNALGTTGNVRLNGGTLQWASGNSQDLSARLTFVSGSTATFDTNGNSVTFATGIGGATSAALVKSGAGTLTLSASSSYSGTTAINGGTLQFIGPQALYGGTTASWTAANITTGSGATLALTVGASNFTAGNVTTLLTNLGGLGGAVTNNGFRAGSTVAFDTSSAGGSFTVADAVKDSTGTGGGAVGLTKLGSGTLTLSGSNAYSGFTTISGGVLSLSGNQSLGSNLTGSSGTLAFGATTVTIGTSVAGDSNGVYSGRLDGTGVVQLRGGANTIMNADGTSGTSGNAFAISASAATIPPNAFALDTGASVSDRKDFGFRNDTSATLTLSSLSGFGAIRGDGAGDGTPRLITVNQSSDTTFNGAIVSHVSTGTVARPITFEKQGAGTLTLAGFIGRQTVSAASGTGAPVNLVANGGLLLVTNTFNSVTSNTAAINATGTVTITSGTLGFAPQALVNTAGTQGVASIRMNGGVLRWHGTNAQDITAGGRLTLVAGQAATFDTNGNDVTLGTALGGGAITGGVTKMGAGTLTINAANTYTGTTTVSTGTLQLGAGSTTGALSDSSAINIASGATFRWNVSTADTAFANSIFGSGTFLKNGTSADLGLTGSNAFSGVLDIRQGKVGLQSANSVAGAPAVSMTATGTLSIGSGFASGTATISGLSGAGVIDAAFTAGTDTRTLRINQATDAVYSGTFNTSGTRVLRVVKGGAGTLTLSGVASAYAAGDLVVDSGTLQIGNAESSVTYFNSTARTVTVNAGDTLLLTYRNVFGAVGSTPTTKVVINGGMVTSSTGATGSVNVLQDLTLNNGATLQAASNYAGYQSFQLTGTATVGGSAASGITSLTGDGGITVGNGTNNTGTTTFNVADVTGNAAADLTISALIANSGNTGANVGALAKSGAGLLLLTGSNTYTGETSITAGTLEVGGAGRLGAGSYAANIANAAALVFSTSADQALSGTLSGAGTLVKSGNGTLTLSGQNTYSGATTVSGGTLSVSSDANLGTAPGSATAGQLVIDGGVLSASAGFTLASNRGLGLGSTSGDGTGTIHVANGTLVYGGVAANNGTGSDGLVKSGTGRLRFTGVNTYTGSTAITAGTFEVGGAGQLGGGTYAAAIANDGTLEFSSSANQTLSGGITGVGSLSKSGAGALTLLGNNTYAGTTTVSGGSLKVNGVVASSSMTVSGGAILAGSGTLADVTLSGGVLSPGNSPGNLTVGTMSWDSTSSYTWQMYDYQDGEGVGWDLVTGTGGLTVTGTGFTFNLVSLSSISPDTIGTAYNWSQTTSGTFRVATFAGGITTPGGTWWTVNTGSFTPFSTLTGSFSVSTTANDMFLVYTYLPPPAYVWTGGDGSWSGGSNWDTTTAPEGTVDLIFSGTGGVSTNDLTTGTGAGQLTTVTSLTFSGSATGAYTIGGNGFTLGSGGVVNQSAITQTIQNDLTLGAVSLVNAEAANLVLSGSILTAGNSLSVTGSSNTTLSGVVTGGGGLVKQGTGTLTLTGPNDYTGGTTITSGSLVVGNGATAGVLPGNVTTNAALAFNRSDDVTFSGTIGGIGTVTKLNANTLTLTGSNTYSGGTIISGGTLRIGAGGTAGSITGDVTNEAALVFNRSDSLTYAGAVGGSGSLTQAGPGTVALTGSNTYSGATLVNAGVLQIGAGGTAGWISPSSAVTIALGGTLAFNRSNAFDFGSPVGGVGTILKLGTADAALTGSNSFSGLVDIQAGRIAFNGVNAAAGAPLVTVASGATLSIGAAYDGGTATIGGLTGSGTVDTNYGGASSTRTLRIAQATSGTFSGSLRDATSSRVLAIVKSGSGTLTLSGVSTYTGTTTVEAGTLQLLGSGSLSSSTVLALADAAGATFDLNGRNQTISGLAGGGATGGSVLLGSGTLEVSRASGNDTFAGVVSGAGRLVKSGSGTLELTGSNSYSGGTTLSAGTLALGHRAALGSGTVTVSGSSTLQASTSLTGAGAVANGVLLTNNLTIGGANDLQLSGTLIQQGANRLLTNTLPGGTTLTLGAIILSGTDTAERRLTFAGSGNTSVSGAIASGTGAVGGVIISGGTVTFAAANTYTGVTFLEGGLLSIADVAALGSGTGNAGRINFTGIGTLRYTAANSGTIANKEVWSDLTTPIASTSTIEVSDAAGSLTITPSGGTRSRPFTKTGPGSLTMNGAFTTNATVTANGGMLVLNGASSYTGQTTVNTGTLVVGSASALGSTAPLAVNGGLLDLAGFSNTVGILTGASGATITANGSGTSTLTVNSASSGTFAGRIQNGTATVALTKSGAGALTLTASNNYSGPTTLSAGTLRMGDSAALGTGTVALNGGTLSSDSTTARTPANAVTVGANVTLGDATNNGLLTFSGNVDFGGATRQITTPSNVVWTGTVTAGSGGLTKTGAGTLTISGTVNYTGATTITAGTLALASNNSVGSNVTSASGDTTGVLSFGANTVNIGNSGANTTAFYYGTVNGTGLMQLRGGAATITGTNGAAGTNTNYQIFTTSVALSPTAFGLNTGISDTDRKDFAYINDNGTVLTLSSLAGFGAIRNDAGGTGTVTRLIVVDQAVDTVFNGALTSHYSGSITRQLSLEKQGAGSLELAGFVGKQAGTAGNAAVFLIANGGLLNVTNPANSTVTADQARLATVTITSGTLAFSTQALINNAGSAGASSILMNGGALRWNAGTTQDMTAGGRLTLVASKTATFDTNGNDVTLGTALAGGAIAAPVTKIGGGILTLTAANNYTGITTVSAGTLALGNGGANGSVAGDLLTNAIVVFNRSGAVTYAGTISGTGAIVKQAANALTLSASNSFSGGSTIQAGSLLIGDDAALGSGTVTLTGGALASNGATSRSIANALVFGGNASLGDASNNGLLAFTGGVDLGGSTRQITTPSNVTIASPVTNGGLTKAGAGTLTLSASNSYAGGSTVSDGTLEFAANGLGTSGSITMNGGTLKWAAGNTQDISGRLALVNATAAILDVGSNNVTLASGFGGGSTAGVTKTGAGTLTLTGTSGYSGATTVSTGTLAVAGAGSLASSAVSLPTPGVALDIAGASGDVTIGGLSGAAGSGVYLGGNTLVANVAGTPIYNGTIHGTGGFTKAGAGSLTLTAIQDFTGRVTVAAGELSILGGNNFLQSASDIYVASGAILGGDSGLLVVADQTLGGYGTINGGLSLDGGAILSPGGSVGTLHADASGVTWNGGMHYLFEVNSGSGTPGVSPGWDLFSTTGELTLAGGDVSQIVIDLTSLSGSGTGLAADFDPTFNYAWKFAVAGAGNPITTFNPTWFTVTTTNFQNSHPGNFYVARGDQLGSAFDSGTSSELFVVYAAVPEPGTLALAGIGLAGMALAAARRRRNARHAPRSAMQARVERRGMPVCRSDAGVP